MKYYKLWQKNNTRKESIKSTHAKLVLAALQHAPIGLESGNLRQTNPLTIFSNNVTNRPSHNENINIDFEDIFPPEDP